MAKRNQMRLIIYGTLCVLAIVLLMDTNFGLPLTRRQLADVLSAGERLTQRGLRREAQLAAEIGRVKSFRSSRFYDLLCHYSQANGHDFAFYAYTPIFSRSRVFIGEQFWNSGDAGRCSILIHEMAHIRRHRRGIAGGFPRGLDEAEAYLTQYLTYRAVGLSYSGQDGPVFWDMMIGVKSYVLPLYPPYASRSDVRWAMEHLEARTAYL